MKITKEQFENSILFFAKKFGQEKNYQAMLDDKIGLPKIVEMITYQMFLRQFNPYHCSNEEYENYKIIHQYVTELHQNGWVSFQ